MCGRVIQSGGPLRYGIVEGLDVRDNRFHNYPPRWHAAPSQELLVIRRNHQTGEVSPDPLRWGLIPYWCQDPKGGRKPINAKCETVDRLPMLREAYRRRRCILPVDGVGWHLAIYSIAGRLVGRRYLSAAASVFILPARTTRSANK